MDSNTIAIPKKLFKNEGVVVLSLTEWEKIQEDLAMLRSKKLEKEIKKARTEKKLIPLNKILKKEGII